MNADCGTAKNIFVTVGAQMPFDRLIKAIDEWAAVHSDYHILAQTGKTFYTPRHIEAVEFIQPREFHQRVLWANLLVSHAGMGSILTALQYGKPIVVMPRLGRLQETRNDHQVATAMRFKATAQVAVALNQEELWLQLDDLGSIGAGEVISENASPELLETVRQFIGSAKT